MEMVLISTDQLKSLIIDGATEGASIALKYNLPKLIRSPTVEEFLTPEETAQLLKVSKVTVWDWEKRGILKKYTIGNQVRYLKSEVTAAVLKKKEATA